MNLLFFKIWLRKLTQNKIYSVANIVGLTIGFTAFILISLFVRYELNWDKNHENYDRIYRVQRHYEKTVYAANGSDISPHSRPATAGLIEGKFPEIEKVSVIRENGDTYLSTDEEHQVFSNKGIHADSCFFDIFTYEFVAGNPKTALTVPNSIVLSETMANSLFGETSAIDKTVLFEKKYPMKVAGVYKDLPLNTSLRPSYVISFSTLKTLRQITRNDVWTGDCMSYVLLKRGANAQLAESKIKDVFSVYESIKNEKLQLCPLSKVYLNFNDRSDYIIVLKLFALIGIFILVMSGFNFINLSLAKASMRGKEVAVKKVIGSKQQSLVFQFLGETIIISLVSLVIAFVIAYSFLPVFSNVVDKQIEFHLKNDWKFMLLTVLVAVSTGFLSGVYPAWFLASHKIASLFKGEFFHKKRE